MGRQRRVILFASLGFALLMGCANPVMPTGGPSDKRPPILLKSVPDTFAVNVNSKTLTLTFDEWIDLKNAEREVQVSPPQAKPPQISVRGKSVFLALTDSLIPNTTYQIHFGSAIRDITEGNVATELELVFTTGPVLDSVWIERLLLDAQTGRPLPGAVLLAYKQELQADTHSAAPDFLAYADSSGRARLRYLPSIPLFLMGLKEASPDFRYNRPGAEWLGFEPEASTSYSVDTLWLFKEEPDSMYFTQVKEVHAGKWALKLSRPADQITLANPEDAQPRLRLQTPPNTADSLLLWIPYFARTDSLDLALLVDGQPIRRRIFPSGRPSPPRMNKPFLQGPPRNPWPLSADRPISMFNPKRVHLLSGTDTLALDARLQDGVLWFYMEFQAAKSTRLCWDSAAIFDVFSLPLPAGQILLESGDFVKWTIEFSESESRHSVLVWAEPEAKPGLRIPFDALDEGRKAHATLAVGRYRLLKTLDLNNDGRWTPGKWKGRIFSEHTHRTNQVFELKSGFDLQTRWK